MYILKRREFKMDSRCTTQQPTGSRPGHVLFQDFAAFKMAQLIFLEKKCDYRNIWNLIKTAIIVIISKNGPGKTYVEYEAGKNASYSLVARRAKK